ncbi:MAG: retropepsin-like aspartic protease [Bacteroidota bacterium]
MQWPEGEKIYALWDTGASHSSISRSLAEKMKLPEMGNSNVLTSAGIQERTDYSINFYLHVPNLMFPALTVSAFNGVTAFDMIIGMDIINKGDFAVTHRYNNTVMSFNLPSVNHIDFEKKRY